MVGLNWGTQKFVFTLTDISAKLPNLFAWKFYGEVKKCFIILLLLTTFNNLNNNLGFSIILEWPLLSLSIKMQKSWWTFLNEYGNGSGSVYGQYILYIVQGGQKQHTLSYKMLCQQVKISSFSNVGRRKGPLGLVWILNGGKNWLIASWKPTVVVPIERIRCAIRCFKALMVRFRASRFVTETNLLNIF